MKNTIRFHFVLLLILTLNTSVFAQYITNGIIQDGTSSNLQGLISEISNTDEDIEGTPYINETYMVAQVSSMSENTVAIRYNAFDDQFEIQGTNNKAYLLNKHLNDLTIHFLNPNKTYKTYNYTDENGARSIGYFVVLISKPNLTLLKKEVITYVEGKKGVTSYERDKPAKFRRNNDKYYYKIGENEVQDLPQNKKNIADIFPNNSNEILTYIKSNHIKTSNDEDLSKLFSYISTLIE